MDKRVGRWWLVAVLVGVGLVVTVMVVSASTAAPQDDRCHVQTRLSTPGKSGAYPDIAVGSNGLVAAVWTEGSGDLQGDKHHGPLYLAWFSDGSPQWHEVEIDPGDPWVFDVAVAVSGARIHVAWSRDKQTILYTTCDPPNYTCASPAVLATAEEALGVDIAVDGDGLPHVVWIQEVIEGDTTLSRVFYRGYDEATSWTPAVVVGGPKSEDSEGPAIAYSNEYIHVVWTEWMGVEHADSIVRYRRWDKNDDDPGDPDLVVDLSKWFTGDYLARNLSIAADGVNNVYVVWDLVSIEDTGARRKYAIGYKYYSSSEDSWRAIRTYPHGADTGSSVSGAEIFKSGEGEDWAEYVQFLRPQVSLAVSGTQTVPVLTWHERVEYDTPEPGMTQAVAQQPVYKVYWDYATQPGSDFDGNLYWATDAITLSTDMCGVVDMGRDSATAHMALVGDLRQVLAGESPGNHLHAVYHERVESDRWGVFYNSNAHVACNYLYLPIILLNASGGSGGG